MSRDAHTCDLMVIGAGVSGMAAALFGARRGLSVALAGAVGGIDFSTGLIDVLGVHPVAEGRRRDDPWAALDELRIERPDHPYSRVEPDELRTAIDEFTDFLGNWGMPFTGHTNRNTHVLTPMGGAKRTWRLPQSMWPGTVALKEKSPTLLVGLKGLKGFSPTQIREAAGERWPGLATVSVPFPDFTGELYPEHIAAALASSQTRQALAEAVRPHLGQAQYAGFPAVLGRENAETVRAHLTELLGVEVFEMPTLPPSLAGSRLRAAFDRGLTDLGVRLFSQKLVIGYQPVQGKGLRLSIGASKPEFEVEARAAILATGRFFGKGLAAERGAVRESVFNLPIAHPEHREDWHSKSFYDPAGHPLNGCGVETDAALRPLGPDGTPFMPNLYAAGAILARQDWTREKCGCGLAIATAYKAVAEAASHLQREDTP